MSRFFQILRNWFSTKPYTKAAYIAAFGAVLGGLGQWYPHIKEACGFNKPKLELHLAHLRQLRMSDEPSLISDVVSTWNFQHVLRQWGWTTSREMLDEQVAWTFDHRLFRVKFSNSGNSPVTLSGFRLEHGTYSYPFGLTNYALKLGAITCLNHEGKPEPSATSLHLNAHASEYIDFVGSLFILPTIDTLRNMVGAPSIGADGEYAKMHPSENSNLVFSIGHEEFVGIPFEEFARNLIWTGKVEGLSFTAEDESGNIYRSNPKDFGQVNF